MKIGINGQDFSPGQTGGSETYFRDLVESLPKQFPNTNFKIFVQGKYSRDIDLASSNISVSKISSRLETINRVKRKMNLTPKIKGLDLLHFPFQRTDFSKASFPIVVTFHDIQDSYLPGYFTQEELKHRKRNNERAIRESDHIITISEFTKKTLIDVYGVSDAKITVIHHGIDNSFFKQQHRLAVKKKYFFYPAATWPHKNHLRLLRAFRKIVKKYPDFNLVLSGATKQASEGVEQYIIENNIQPHVSHLGYVDYNELPKLYLGSFALIFPSLFEGFGYPVLEAMATGCPVACSNTTSLPEVAGDAAIYFNPLSEKEIFDTMEKLILDKSLRQHLSISGKLHAKSFTKEKMVKKTYQLYQTVIGKFND